MLATKDGHSPYRFAVDADHGDPSDPFVVRVQPAGSVELTLVGERRVGQRLRVVLEASWDHFSSGNFESYFESDPTWCVCFSDTSPVARIERLPADVYYSAALFDGARLIATEPGILRLRPFEMKQLEFHLGVGATVVVRATNSEGVPAENLQLNLYPGIHSIRGKLVTPEGVPAPSWSTACSVYASYEGHRFELQCRPHEDGTFVLEPLIEGKYSIRASAHFGVQLGSVEVAGVVACTAGLELYFPRVFELALRILDAGSGKSRRGEVTVRGIDGKHVSGTDIYEEEAPNQSERENILELCPGAYTIFARAEDGAFAIVRSFEVRAQTSVQSLDIEVPPPALVYLTRGAGQGGTLPYVYYEVTCEGFVVADDSFATPRSGPIPIPSMTSTLEFVIETLDTATEHAPRVREASRVLTLGPGTTLELDLERDFD